MSDSFFGKALAALKEKLTPPAPGPSSRVWDPAVLQREMEKHARNAAQEGMVDLEGRMNTAGLSNKASECADSWYHIARPELDTDVTSRLGKRYQLLVPAATLQASGEGISISSVEAYCLVSKEGQGVIQCIVSIMAVNRGTKVKRRLTERRRFRFERAPVAGSNESVPIKVEVSPFFRSFEEA